MQNPSISSFSRALVALAALSGAAAAQSTVHFSVDWQSLTVGTPDSAFGFPITEGDVLVPTAPAIGLGPLPGPSIAWSAGFAPVPGLGLFGHAGCAGHAGSTPCIVEVDALSFGRDFAPLAGMTLKHFVRFSTDEYARGIFGMPASPTVWDESLAGDLCADVLVDFGIGAMPTPPFGAAMPGSVAFLDGNGLASLTPALYPGLGLVEPRPPTPVLPKLGDNLDALEMDPGSATGGPPPFGFFFSLDAAFPDPFTGIPNTGSAAAHGFPPGAVLHTPVPGGAPVLYAPPPLLGLDLVGGPQSDDLDALALAENGLAGYQPSQTPFDWGVAGGSDMLLFSVRRGSAVIGMPDSLFGIPISEGDILTTPIPTALGGISPFPAIFIAAENIGLATLRSGTGGNFNDELDALDLDPKGLLDCNGNGVEDAIDIATGTSPDTNGNGIPDECEGGVTYDCFCPSPLGPCGNDDATAGCRNSTGQGGLLTATGSTSVGADDLVLTTTQMPAFTPGLMLMGPGIGGPLPFFDGRRCVNGALLRWPVKFAGATGSFSYGPGLSAFSIANFPPAYWLTPGSVWHFQTWYRDNTGPCGSGANISNSASVLFTL
ncbi:MAG TPA: hypothetical protein VMT18_02035 [Planctomycetota bacterium]|nr:hypothetical protein [Planctomycetota bacterium]